MLHYCRKYIKIILGLLLTLLEVQNVSFKMDEMFIV